MPRKISPHAVLAALKIRRERDRKLRELRFEEAKRKEEGVVLTAREEVEQFDWYGRVARENQKPPAWNWFTWLILAGRGFGKTRTGAEYIRSLVETGKARRIALVGPTMNDVRNTMVEGPTGILSACPPWDQPIYEPSKRRITWYPNPKAGRTEKAVALCYSSETPDALRGPQHDAAWGDELAAWEYCQETFDQLLFGLRLGLDPRVVFTTTPRPIPLVKALLKDETVAVTRGSTYDNQANLAKQTLAQLKRRYEGTKLGRQELHGEVIEDIEGALWTSWILDRNRVDRAPDMARIVVAVDPSGSSKEGGAEQGIVVCGRGVDHHGYVLEDVSCRESPLGWATVAVRAYLDWQADAIVYERNFGGDMVRSTLEVAMRNAGFYIPLIEVVASRSKLIRAEPVASLYEQCRIHHPRCATKLGAGVTIAPDLERLEDQLCNWVPGETSPDRLDAMVWGMTELMVDETGLESGPNPHAGYRG